MKPLRIIRPISGVLAVLAACSLLSPQKALATPPQVGEVLLPKQPVWLRDYRNTADLNERVVLEAIGDPTSIRIRTSAGWGAVGYLAANHFEGVVRAADMQGAPLPGRFGTLTFDLEDDGSVSAVLRIGGDVHAQKWVISPTPSEEPPNGRYADVDGLPGVISKVPPRYPASARKAGIEGTVMVEALVGKDGRVKDIRIVKSIPMLDESAMDAVRKWVFKPALLRNKPVAVWVAVPVRFSAK